MLTATDLNNILRIERQRVKLQNQRNTAITKLKMLDPTYDPPACMKYKNGLLEQRIEVPQEEYPQHNFMGLILKESLETTQMVEHIIIAMCPPT